MAAPKGVEGNWIDAKKAVYVFGSKRLGSMGPTAASFSSEADAQASFRALQSKYAGILGSRSAAIRRADLGDKGVFYRAMVGPFGSTEEATQFCLNLKSAGGQCVVQRN